MSLSFRKLFCVFTLLAIFGYSDFLQSSGLSSDTNYNNNTFFNFYDQINDPCQFRDPRSLPTPLIQRVFWDANFKYENFRRGYQSNPENALKTWLMSTSTFASAKSVDDIELNVITGNGENHVAIYEVFLNKYPEDRFILKISIDSSEAQSLWQVQNSIVGHPECFLRPNLGFRSVVTEEELTFFPNIPKVFEVAKVLVNIKAGRFSKEGETIYHYLILMEKAPGKPLASFNFDNPKTLDAYRIAGKSLGYLHYLMNPNPESPFKEWKTVTHGDLHPNNVFYDPKKNLVTFIDNGDMELNEVYGDFYQLAYGRLEQYINPKNANSYVDPLLEVLYGLEAKTRNLPRAFNWMENWWHKKAPDKTLHPQKAIINGLNNSDYIRKIPESDDFKQVKMIFDNFKAAVQGYLEALPPNKDNEVYEYFGQKCKDIANSMMRHYSDPSKANEAIEPNLDSALRRLLPPEFIACMDENRFD